MKGFKEFLLQTNALALAIGVIIGGAAGKVVSSLVNDILMPPMGLLLGNVDFSNLFISLGSTHYDTLAQAQAAGAPTLRYGVFLNSVIDFVIVAFCIYMISKALLKPAPAGPQMKECPQCGEMVIAKAKKCKFCTSPF